MFLRKSELDKKGMQLVPCIAILCESQGDDDDGTESLRSKLEDVTIENTRIWAGKLRIMH